jgi:Tol biopolymer transport system component
MAFTISAAHQGQTAGVVGVASATSTGEIGNGSSFQPSLSSDGRYIAFSSLATNLVAGDTNGAPDVFWRDTCRGAPSGCTPSTQRVSLDLSGHQLPDGATVNSTIAPANVISGDGRFVLFLAEISEVLTSYPGVPDYAVELFVRDTCTGQPATCIPSTALVSQGAQGQPANLSVHTASMSRDGRVVAFLSPASNLVSETVLYQQMFVRETCFGASGACTPVTRLVSVSTSGGASVGSVRSGTISSGGRQAVFQSNGSDLVAGDSNGSDDIFVRDTCVGAPAGCAPSTVLASPSLAGTVQGITYAGYPSISADGRFVVFQSNASNLVSADTHGTPQVFLRDTCLGASGACTPSTSLVSAAPDGTPADEDSNVNGSAVLSADGRYVAFASIANNLLPGVSPPACYVKDTCAGAPAGCTPRLQLVSVDGQGKPLGGCLNGLGGDGVPGLSADGHTGIYERFDQASNAVQAYVVLTGF